MKERLLDQASHEYSPKRRLVALVFLAPVFLILLPCVFIGVGARMDQWLQWPLILERPLNVVLGLLLILPSSLFAMWSIYQQFTLGRGTPVPLMATQRLIIEPPYSYCRNPMALGATGMYLAVAILFRSGGAVILVLLFAGLLACYIKWGEEREMQARFGSEYLAYRHRTPFLVPRLRNRD